MNYFSTDIICPYCKVKQSRSTKNPNRLEVIYCDEEIGCGHPFATKFSVITWAEVFKLVDPDAGVDYPEYDELFK